MRFLQKIFNPPKKDGESGTAPTDQHTESHLPIDEKFIFYFKKNGGKFLYCDTLDEVYDHFNHILSENQWQGTKVFCPNPELQQRFGNSGTHYTSRPEADVSFFLTLCEYLIADTGSILVSSNQIGEKNLRELPDHFIVYATTSQLVENIGEGLRGIKHKYQGNIPSNITTLKHFEMMAEKDFLSYGSSLKNLYLLLLEDM